MTDEGRNYYNKIASLLDDIEDLEANTRKDADIVSGRVRIASPRHLTEALLAPNLMKIAQKYPALELDFTLADRAIDMVSEAVDIAIRIGSLPDTSYSAIRLGEFQQVLCAAPSWIEAHGKIRHPNEIDGKLITAYRFPGSANGYPWIFSKDNNVTEINPVAHIRFDDLDTYVSAGRAGLGPICVLSFQAAHSLSAGTLVQMLSNWKGASIAIHALTPERRHRSRRVEATLNWIKDCIKN